MDATTIFILGIAATAVLAAAAVFTVAFRRGPERGPVAGGVTGRLDRRAIQRDLAARESREAALQGDGTSAVATLTEEDAAEGEVDIEEVPDPLLVREPLTPEEFGVARRQFFNRAILGLFGGAFLGGLTISFLAFLWPRLGSGFGTPINVGSAALLRRDMDQGDGTFAPVFVSAAQAWVVPFTAQGIVGSSFETIPEVVAGGEGGGISLMALWQRCVHLGCRVPACNSSQGFECPCHGSKYNLHGEYEDGPAPRNLDRFAVEIDSRGDLIVNTGEVRETPRSKNKTIAYPQGPNCL
jgi:cytochrome b6-f complex iron-sulfur subunit